MQARESRRHTRRNTLPTLNHKYSLLEERENSESPRVKHKYEELLCTNDEPVFQEGHPLYTSNDPSQNHNNPHTKSDHAHKNDDPLNENSEQFHNDDTPFCTTGDRLYTSNGGSLEVDDRLVQNDHQLIRNKNPFIRRTQGKKLPLLVKMGGNSAAGENIPLQERRSDDDDPTFRDSDEQLL